MKTIYKSKGMGIYSNEDRCGECNRKIKTDKEFKTGRCTKCLEFQEEDGYELETVLETGRIVTEWITKGK
jgi:hypothetical protein